MIKISYKKIILIAVIFSIISAIILIWWNFIAKRLTHIPYATIQAPVVETVKKESENSPLAASLAKGLEIPWALDFLPDGSIIFTERSGRIRLIRENSQS